MIDSADLATETIALIGARDFLGELAQVRASATLETLGADSAAINWTFQRRRLERNGTAGMIGIETAARLSPNKYDELPRLRTAALRLGQLWEALAVISPEASEAALLSAAIGYEIADYQANSATLAERLSRTSFEWSMAPMFTDFLRRRLLSVVAQQEELESTKPVFSDLPSFVTAAADRLLGRGLASVSRYLLGGDQEKMSEADDLLDQAREAYSRAGRFQEAGLCFATAALLPLIQRRSIWEQISASSESGRWGRYLKLLGRGTSGQPKNARSHSELWPSQIAALREGLLTSNHSVVLRLPTSAGKTRIAEIAIAHQLSVQPASRCLYVAPYRALVSEIEDTFINLFADLGVKVSSFLGGYDSDRFEQFMVEESDLLVVTPERLNLLERVSPDYFDQVSLIVLDEGQIVGDSTRGAQYELLISRLRVRLPNARFLVMSAVVSDQTLSDFANWLQTPSSLIVRSNWRPSVQRVSRFLWREDKGVIRYEASEDLDFQGSFLHGVISKREFEHVNPATGRTIRPSFPSPNSKSQTAAELALHFSAVGPVLVFCPQRNYVESIAESFRRRIELSTLTNEEIPSRFAEADRPSSRSAAEWLGADHKITRLLRRGIGIHHGRLPDSVRSTIEADFREGQLSVLIATTTLAQGVNLPVRTVIVHSCHRYDEASGQVRVPAREYWNIAGRAGRAGFETEGTIVHLVFNSKDERDFRFYQSHRQTVESIESVLIDILYELKERRIASEDVARLLNSEVLALMTEESPDQFEETVNAVLNRSLMAVQTSGSQEAIESISALMMKEGERVRRQVQNREVLRAFRTTGISSDSCETISEILREKSSYADHLIFPFSETPRALIELLVRVVSVVPEFVLDTEPPVDYVEATSLWLSGETVSGIEHRLLGGIDSDSQFGRFAGQFFVNVLPWAASVVLTLARKELNLDEGELPPTSLSIPSMIRYGVPSPEAAWCMSVGINSRQAAIEMAADYRASGGQTNYGAFRKWFTGMEATDLMGRYSLQGKALATAIRAVTQFGVSPLTDQAFDIVATLPADIEVVGTQYERRWAIARSLRSEESLSLRRDLGNAYDRNAILVLRGNSEVGYVPRSFAKLLAPEMDLGLRLIGKVVSAQDAQVVMRVEPEVNSVPNDS